MERYGATPEVFARIGRKNHKHSVNNPYSQFQDEYSLEDILNAPMVHDPLTKLQCCPTSDGSGAAILASEDSIPDDVLDGRERAGILEERTGLPLGFSSVPLHRTPIRV